MSSTVTLRVGRLTCALCVGDIMERVHLVPGVVRVAVGGVEHGRSWVTVNGEPGVSVTRLSRELSRAGFHNAAADGHVAVPADNHDRRAR